ncbi:hypothetical protein [Leifsonia sp. NPDC058248]|uniref:hypothetical protein n=1 Tax=Leifsonia sp. NPDC058248 TaxID=3346402 RepID=UPI0036DEB32E
MTGPSEPVEVTYSAGDEAPRLLASWREALDVIDAHPRVKFAATGDDPDFHRLAWIAREGTENVVTLGVVRHGEQTVIAANHGDGTVSSLVQVLKEFFVPLDRVGELESTLRLSLLMASGATREQLPASRAIEVYTASGTIYQIDLATMFLTRMPGLLPPQEADFPEPSDLRRDYKPIKILSIQQLEVGRPAIFRLEPLGDPKRVAFTTRTTTVIVMITGVQPQAFSARSSDK